MSTVVNKETECPNLIHDHVDHTSHDSLNVEDVETNDCESQGFVASIGNYVLVKMFYFLILIYPCI